VFERNKIDNSLQLNAVPAEITLDDGEIVKGRFIINAARSISDVLNGDTHFLDFETYAGERAMIARSALRSVKIVQVPQVPNFKVRAQGETFEPHVILGLEASAPWDEVRAAYLKLSKMYHPDRFSAHDMPHEVRDYMSVMARRINAAYHALEAPVLAARRANLNKAQPIFTSQPRA